MKPVIEADSSSALNRNMFLKGVKKPIQDLELRPIHLKWDILNTFLIYVSSWSYVPNLYVFKH